MYINVCSLIIITTVKRINDVHLRSHNKHVIRARCGVQNNKNDASRRAHIVRLCFAYVLEDRTFVRQASATRFPIIIETQTPTTVLLRFFFSFSSHGTTTFGSKKKYSPFRRCPHITIGRRERETSAIEIALKR